MVGVTNVYVRAGDGRVGLRFDPRWLAAVQSAARAQGLELSRSVRASSAAQVFADITLYSQQALSVTNLALAVTNVVQAVHRRGAPNVGITMHGVTSGGHPFTVSGGNPAQVRARLEEMLESPE